jgi:NADH:ubiquinone oxidoreductase subunit 2 (subunit N)
MMSALLAGATAASAAADKVTIPSIRYLSILPPIILIGGAVVLLALASLVKAPLRVRVSTIGSVIISGGALGISIWQWADVLSHGPHTYIAHAVVMDGFSVLITMLVSAAMLVTSLVADGYLSREGIGGAEFYVLALVSA